ncbi:MAG: hypothetical protein C0605_15710 [Hyphomicrobiales bacterium]|nr:MAG: hypothetical protein C0605_15710 [Hyphomicrobiales bacterium]
MKPITLLAGMATAMLMLAPAVQAASLANQDSTDYSFTVEENGKSSTVTVPAKNTLENICMNGCVITFPDNDPMDIYADDKMFIEEGNLFFESTEEPGEKGEEGKEDEGKTTD